MELIGTYFTTQEQQAMQFLDNDDFLFIESDFLW